MRQAPGSTPEILVFLYLIQDLDVLLPILKALRGLRADVGAFVAPGLLVESPRVKTALEREGIPYFTCGAIEFKLRMAPKLRGVRAMISAADTSAYAHKAAHYFVNRANRMGVMTFTLQHGLENIGLTYFDSEFPIDSVQFASKTIFIWGGLESLHPGVPDHVRRVCIPVGCPKEFSVEDSLVPKIDRYKRLVAIFENLHWSRYSDRYRQRFLEDLEATAAAHPDVTLLVKPHHAGRWLTDHYRGRLPSAPNLVMADPRLPKWEPFTAPAIIRAADAVITTPSTTGFDAVSMNRPVSIVGYDLDLDLYEPLPIIRKRGDWSSFIEAACSQKEMQHAEAAKSFRNKFTRPGNPATAIANHVLSALGKDRAAAARPAQPRFDQPEATL